MSNLWALVVLAVLAIAGLGIMLFVIIRLLFHLEQQGRSFVEASRIYGSSLERMAEKVTADQQTFVQHSWERQVNDERRQGHMPGSPVPPDYEPPMPTMDDAGNGRMPYEPEMFNTR